MINQPMNGLRVGARRLVSQLGTLATRSTEPRILMYHRVVESEHRLSVTPHLFRRHLDVLQSLGLEVLSVKDLLARRDEPGLNAVALSFDDGYSEMATLVAPELKARGMGATFYVLPRFASQPQDISPEAGWVDGGKQFLSTEQIIQLDEDGFEMAAHGLTHRCLPDLPNIIARRELTESRLELESILGHQVFGFAYPKGSYCLNHSEMARKAGYTYAVTVDPGHLGSGSPDHLLPRTEIAGGDDSQLLKNKLVGGLDLWHASLNKTKKITTLVAGRA